MNARVAAVNAKWQVVNVVVLVVHLLVASSLLVGAIGTLRWRDWGRRLLMAACLGAIVFELARLWPTLLTARETQEIMNTFMPRLMQAPKGAGNPPNMDALMGGIMKVIGIASLVFMVAFTAAKLLFYALAARYLRKPSVTGLFPQGQAASVGLTGTHYG
jgi:hypothetical protein